MFKVRKDKIDGIGNWLWPEEDEEMWRVIKSDWENSHREKIFKYVKNFDCVVQAGGACGMYPRLLSEFFNVVYTFEIEPDNWHCLVHNCHRPNIFPFKAAVGPRPGFVRFTKTPPKNVGLAQVTEDQQAYTPQLTIDQFRFPKCDLIMLDLEGYEEFALMGAINTIQKHRPILFVESAEHFPGKVENLFNYQILDQSVLDTVYGPR